jgi:hypothetical protein
MSELVPATLRDRRTQAWRRDREASIARAQARKRVREDERPTGEAALMLHKAEAMRAVVTQLGPSARGWALATKAADLERRAFAADPTLRPGWAAS